MSTVHVLTLSPYLPHAVLDELLTSTERTLLAHGAERIWMDPAQSSLTVVAEFPEVPEVPVSPDLVAGVPALVGQEAATPT